jgi:hypothetical protein
MTQTALKLFYPEVKNYRIFVHFFLFKILAHITLDLQKNWIAGGMLIYILTKLAMITYIQTDLGLKLNYCFLRGSV